MAEYIPFITASAFIALVFAHMYLNYAGRPDEEEMIRRIVEIRLARRWEKDIQAKLEVELDNKVELRV